MHMVMAQLGKNDPADRYYQIYARDLIDRTNKEVRYVEFKEATSKLREREITVLKENGNVLQIGLISSAEYIKPLLISIVCISYYWNSTVFT